MGHTWPARSSRSRTLLAKAGSLIHGASITHATPAMRPGVTLHATFFSSRPVTVGLSPMWSRSPPLTIPQRQGALRTPGLIAANWNVVLVSAYPTGAMAYLRRSPVSAPSQQLSRKVPNERPYSCRREGDSSPSHDACRLEAVAACLRQANDLLSAHHAHAGGHSRHPDHLHAGGFAWLSTTAGRWGALGNPVDLC